MLAKKKRMLIVEPSRQLVKRVVEVLSEETSALVVYYEGKKTVPGEAFDVLVATPEAYLQLPRPHFELPSFDLVVFDHVPNFEMRQVILSYSPSPGPFGYQEASLSNYCDS